MAGLPLLIRFLYVPGFTGQYKLSDGVSVDGAGDDTVQTRSAHNGPGLDVPVAPAQFESLRVPALNVSYFASETGQGIYAAERDGPRGSDIYKIGDLQSTAGCALGRAEMFVVPQYFRDGLERDAI